MATVWLEGSPHAFAADDTPRVVRQRLGRMGMVLPRGETDKAVAVRPDDRLGAAEYDFAVVAARPPPQQQQQQQQQQPSEAPAPPAPPALPAPPPADPPRGYAPSPLLVPPPGSLPPSRVSALPQQSPPGYLRPRAPPVQRPGAIVRAVPKAVPGAVFSLRTWLSQPGALARMQYLEECQLLRVPDVHREAGWTLQRPEESVQGARRHVLLDKGRFLEEATAGLVHCVCPAGAAPISPHAAPADLWAVVRTDMHFRGFAKDRGTLQRADDAAAQEWLYEPAAPGCPAAALAAAGWAERSFAHWLQPEPAPAAAGGSEQPVATACAAQGGAGAARGTRFGGDCLMVYGCNFTPTTCFTFDWPYGGAGGWHEPGKVLACSSSAAVVVVPPLVEAADEDRVTAYVLSSDPNCREGRAHGEASYVYEVGAQEPEACREGLALMLLELDDYDLCPFQQRQSPTWSGRCVAAELPALLGLLTEEALVGHLKERVAADRLVPLLNHSDLCSRTLLHYLGRLGWAQALRLCLAQGGGAVLGVADRWRFLPLHYAAAAKDQTVVEAMAADMSELQREKALRKVAAECDVFQLLGPGPAAVKLREVLERGLHKAAQPPRPKRRRRNAWDPSKDTDVDISKVDGDGAIVL
eukprot:TRINITY_DN4952_c0_g1_i1.p1 TRINITY_DN4952_c0_g1~~TRINITY_DN4952_c0_g1_i1.p1  ORF type:complete len:664 (+),score=228.65 TRINITY_DN4952_c0_g1_i1:76-1992(+)